MVVFFQTSKSSTGKKGAVLQNGPFSESIQKELHKFSESEDTINFNYLSDPTFDFRERPTTLNIPPRDEFEVFKQNVSDSKPLRSRTTSAGSSHAHEPRDHRRSVTEQELEDEEMMEMYATRSRSDHHALSYLF